MAIAEQSSKTTQQSTETPYENVGRQAWILLWIAFGIFVILLLGIPLSLNWYLHSATDPLPARVEGIRGTTLVVKADSPSLPLTHRSIAWRQCNCEAIAN